jgi:hypothetical protein
LIGKNPCQDFPLKGGFATLFFYIYKKKFKKFLNFLKHEQLFVKIAVRRTAIFFKKL